MLVKHWAWSENGHEAMVGAQLAFDGSVLLKFSLEELLPDVFPANLYNVCTLGCPLVLAEKLLFVCVRRYDRLDIAGEQRRYELALVSIGIEKLFQGEEANSVFCDLSTICELDDDFSSFWSLRFCTDDMEELLILKYQPNGFGQLQRFNVAYKEMVASIQWDNPLRPLHLGYLKGVQLFHCSDKLFLLKLENFTDRVTVIDLLLTSNSPHFETIQPIGPDFDQQFGYPPDIHDDPRAFYKTTRFSCDQLLVLVKHHGQLLLWSLSLAYLSWKKVATLANTISPQFPLTSSRRRDDWSIVANECELNSIGLAVNGEKVRACKLWFGMPTLKELALGAVKRHFNYGKVKKAISEGEIILPYGVVRKLM